MARRATYFFDVEKANSQRLLVSGGWEFMRPKGSVPPKAMTTALAKALDLMEYDVGFLAADEAKALADQSVPFESSRKTASQAPVTTMTVGDGSLITFIRFPSLRPGQDVPPADLMDKLSRKIVSERNKARLVVALSDWGWLGEREYLAQNPRVVPDILLGSGQGSGVNGRIEAKGRCLWVRPYDRGRTISRIRLMAWPDREQGFVWKEPENVRCFTVGLGDMYEDYPDVSAILQ